tara:strand:- start:786 stop:1136 length:351 start_codon:yes stop_codon:yes gene_type:complete
MAKDKNIVSVDIEPSTRKDKKLMAIFKNKDKKKIKVVHFGAKSYRDYTLISDKKSQFYIPDEGKRNSVKALYINRHKKRENWNEPDNAGSLSRFVLWEKPKLSDSINFYKKKFDLK